MDILESDNPKDCKECCSKMFEAWLDENTQENTTWEILINALEKLPTGIR